MDKVEKSNAMRLMEKAGLPYEAVAYPSHGEALDAGEVARLLGVPPESVFKTLVLSGAGRHFVCVIPGNRELDLKKAAAHFKVKSLEMCPAAALKELTGYVRGGCSPLGMKKPFPTALDESAAERPWILVSGGRIGLQIKARPEDLAQVAGMVTARLTREAGAAG